LLHQKDLTISHHLDLLDQKKVIIAEQKDLIIELNVIIENEEQEIMRMEDVVGERAEKIRSLELRIDILNDTISSMNQQLQLVKDNARRQLKASRRSRQPGDGETMYDHLKMRYKNAMIRFHNLEKEMLQNTESLEQYIEFLHATLERHKIFDDSCDLVSSLNFHLIQSHLQF
jgi:TolA-binding protein